MSLSTSDLERMADELYKQRHITESVYCGECGYNLRTLPYIYTCPECGNNYNARPLKMEGIFTPYQAEIPFGDVFAVLVSVLGVGLMIWGGIVQWRISWFVCAAFCLLLATLFWRRAHRRFVQLSKSRKIAHMIAMEEGE